MRGIIDCHAHIGSFGDITNESSVWTKLTLESLIAHLDRFNVARAVLLSFSSWNAASQWISPTEHILEAFKRYPDRLIPFCAVEVRERCFPERIKEYVIMGCKGFGEHTSRIPVDHDFNLDLYRLCGRLGIPILLHMASSLGDAYGILDSPDLRGLESVAKKHTDVDFILHGPGWWRSISTDKTEFDLPIGKAGRAVFLLEEYSNVYADLSAGSGYNALNRDLEFARSFLKKLHRKILYGTDLLAFFEPEKVLQNLLDGLKLTREAYENIYYKNLEEILKN